MSEWISVSERLPAYGVPVIVVTANGVVQHYTFKLFMDDDENYAWTDLDEGDYYEIDDFSHWLPLPMPPKTKAP